MDSFLDLRLSNTNLGVGSKKEHNLLGDILSLGPNEKGKNVVAVTVSEDESGKQKKAEKTFYCEYCTMTFPNGHALGGHLNAHKYERALAKGDKALGLPPGGVVNPYVARRFHGVPGFSGHLPLCRSPLGINIHSPMISKPRFPSIHQSTFGLVRWPRAPGLVNPSQTWIPRGVFPSLRPTGFNPRPIAYSAGTRIRSDGSREIIFQEIIYPTFSQCYKE